MEENEIREPDLPESLVKIIIMLREKIHSFTKEPTLYAPTVTLACGQPQVP